jgi:type I restriction enzyme S subunit
MTSTFPKARLVSFLRHRKEFFTLDDTGRYKRVRVQLHNKGIVLRDMVKGAVLRTKKQQAARVGQLLVAEIDAKVGGFGIVPPELDGAIVSSHYFLYDIDESKCLRGWLNAFIRAGGLEEQVKARGTTNYAAIRPEHILDFEIPLPAPPEQQRIVARIEELAAKIEEALRLRKEVESSLRGVSLGAYREITKGARRLPIAEVAPLIRRPVGVEPSVKYHELGIRSFGKGTH